MQARALTAGKLLRFAPSFFSRHTFPPQISLGTSNLFTLDLPSIAKPGEVALPAKTCVAVLTRRSLIQIATMIWVAAFFRSPVSHEDQGLGTLDQGWTEPRCPAYFSPNSRIWCIWGSINGSTCYFGVYGDQLMTQIAILVCPIGLSWVDRPGAHAST